MQSGWTTLTEASQRQRKALRGAVAARTAGWREADRLVAAAMFVGAGTGAFFFLDPAFRRGERPEPAP